MKKINLSGISEILSEKELKNVMGGSLGCNAPYSLLCNTGDTCYAGFSSGKCGRFTLPGEVLSVCGCIVS